LIANERGAEKRPFFLGGSPILLLDFQIQIQIQIQGRGRRPTPTRDPQSRGPLDSALLKTAATQVKMAMFQVP